MNRPLRILRNFTGYPGGTKRDFTAGEEFEADPAFAELLLSKGLAEAAGPSPAPFASDAEEETEGTFFDD